MRPFYIITAIFFLLFLSACDKQDAFDKIVDKDKDAFAKEFIEELIAANSAINEKIGDNMRTQESADGMNKIIQALHGREIKSKKYLGYTYNTEYSKELLNGGPSTSNVYWQFIYEYEMDEFYSVFNVMVIEQNGQNKIDGIDVKLYEESWNERSTISLKGKGFTHYLVLLICIIEVLLIAISLAVMLRSNLRRKWLLAIVILMGNLVIVFNWTTGEFLFDAITLSFFGVGYSEGDLIAPINLTFSIPLGVLYFWATYMRRKRFEKRAIIYEREHGITSDI